MDDSRIKADNEIPFVQELVRKATHMCALVIPVGYYVLKLSKGDMLLIMVPITLFMVLIDISRLRGWAFWHKFAVHIGGRMIRDHENRGDFTGATYILLSVCLTVALFDRHIAVPALAFIIVGDTFAALIGRKFGRLHFGRKTVEGSLGCLFGTLIVAFITPGLPTVVAVAGAVSATLAEAASFKIDDNISVPLTSGLIMTLVLRIITYS